MRAVRRKWHKLSKISHPDKCRDKQDEAAMEAATVKTTMLNDAYTKLKTRENRNDYDDRSSATEEGSGEDFDDHVRANETFEEYQQRTKERDREIRQAQAAQQLASRFRAATTPGTPAGGGLRRRRSSASAWASSAAAAS